jgi:hypothetical protein
MKLYKDNRIQVQVVLLMAVLLLVSGCSGPALSPSPDEATVIEKASPSDEAVLMANPVTWGPSYYSDDTNIEIARNRNELKLIQQVSPNAITGKVGGPSYTDDETILGAHSSPKVTTGSVTWGPSYYTDDVTIEAERNRDELELMSQVDQKALKGVAESPSYHQ